MYDYGEYCPISKAVQVLGERWTLLIVREMLSGVTRFNEFRRYLPRISPTLLQSRLRALEDRGLVVRRKVHELRGHEYQLTAAGRELEPLIMMLGQWAVRWVDASMSDDEVNVDVLMRDIQSTLVYERLPSGRSVLLFQFSDIASGGRWYLIAEQGRAEICDDDRGLDVDVYLTATRKTMVDIWQGSLTPGQAVADGRLKVSGSGAYTRTLASWLGRSPFAGVARGVRVTTG